MHVFIALLFPIVPLVDNLSHDTDFRAHDENHVFVVWLVNVRVTQIHLLLHIWALGKITDDEGEHF